MKVKLEEVRQFAFHIAMLLCGQRSRYSIDVLKEVFSGDKLAAWQVHRVRRASPA